MTEDAMFAALVAERTARDAGRPFEQALVVAVAADATATVVLNGNADTPETRVAGFKSLGFQPVAGDAVWVYRNGRDRLIVGVLADPWHYVGAAGEPPFLNGWTNVAPGGQQQLRFTRRNGHTEVQGHVIVPAGGLTTIFTLPVGYEPFDDMLIPVVHNGAFGYVSVLDTARTVSLGVVGTVGAAVGLNFSYRTGP